MSSGSLDHYKVWISSNSRANTCTKALIVQEKSAVVSKIKLSMCKYKPIIVETEMHSKLVDPTIQFTVEDTRKDDSMPFFDTLITQEPDRTLSLKV